MKRRVRLVPLAAFAALLLPPGAAWLVQQGSEPRYEATARLLLPETQSPPETIEQRGAAAPSAEEEVLSPEVIARAVELLERRQIPVAGDRVLLSLSDILIDRLRVDQKPASDSQEVILRYHTASREEAIPVLSAILDAIVETSDSQALSPQRIAAANDDERELEQLDEAVLRQKDLAHGAELHWQQLSSETAARHARQEKLKQLGQALAEAHRKRVEAEHRSQQAEQDVAAGVPVELLAARLPDGELRAFILNLFNGEKLQRELRDRQERLQQLAGIYGRNHPAVRELQKRIGELLQQVAAESRPSAEEPELTPAQMFLQTLQGACREAQELAADLQQELDAETAVVDEERGAEQSLADHRDELKFLEAERARVQHRLDKSRRELAAAAVTIAQPATLNPEPITSGAAVPLAIGGSLGVFFCIAILWSAARRRTSVAGPSTVAEHRRAYRRFLSHEERRLVQVKSMAAAGDVG